MENARTITDPKKNTHQIIGEAKRSGRPIVITKSGSPECVLLSQRVFEKRLKKLNLLKLLAESEAAFRGRAQQRRSRCDY
jgi:prevent-host-death family protein